MAENIIKADKKRMIDDDEHMESSDGHKKYKADDPTRISLKFVNQMGGEFFVRVKPTMKLGKVVDIYCEKHRLVKGATRFFYNNNRIQSFLTPADMGMEDKDEIEVYTEVGGGGFSL